LLFKGSSEMGDIMRLVMELGDCGDNS